MIDGIDMHGSDAWNGMQWVTGDGWSGIGHFY